MKHALFFLIMTRYIKIEIQAKQKRINEIVAFLNVSISDDSLFRVFSCFIFYFLIFI
jgi:hypothetical protein